MLILWVLAGLLMGILVNYLADVLPTQRKLATPSWWPLSKRSLSGSLSRPRVALVLLAVFIAAIVIFLRPPLDLQPLVYFVVMAFFLLVTVIDIEHRLVLHMVSLAGAVLMGLVGLSRHGLTSTLLGGAAGFAGMLTLYFLGDVVARLLARMRGQQWDDVALGFGDVNLAGVIGLLMGWPGVLAAVFLGVLIAGLYSAVYIVWMLIRGKYSAFTAIAYAPFLCLGALFLFTVAVY